MRDQWLSDKHRAEHDLALVRRRLEDLGARLAEKKEPDPPWLIRASEREIALTEQMQAARKSGNYASDIEAQLQKVRDKIGAHLGINSEASREPDARTLEIRRHQVAERKLVAQIAGLAQSISDYDAGTHPEFVQDEAQAAEAHEQVLYSSHERERAAFEKHERAEKEVRFQAWLAKRRASAQPLTG